MKEIILPNLENSQRNRTHLTSAAPEVNSAVALLFDKYCDYLAHNDKNAVRYNAVETVKQHIKIIFLDLYTCWESDNERYVGYSRGRPAYLRGGSYWDYDRHQPTINYRIYPNIVDFLEATGFIENHKAKAGFGKKSSRMRARMKLIEFARQLKISWAHTRVNPNKPAIIVKDENKKETEHPNPGEFDLESARKNLRRINENLSDSFINLDISDEAHHNLSRRMVQDNVGEETGGLDFTNRFLRRIFSLGSFQIGGRFYGGWWQGVPQEYRKHIEIEGLVTVECDYSTMMPRIMYAREGIDPPNDAYTLGGWDGAANEKKTLRKITKKAFNQLVNSKPAMKSPKRWNSFSPEIEPEELPAGWFEWDENKKRKHRRKAFHDLTGRDYNDLLHDLTRFHQPIHQHFFSQAWGWVQNVDSQIAEKVMIKLLDHEFPITALPIHDSFIVRIGCNAVLNHAMIEAFEEVVGAECKVDKDATIFDIEEPNPGIRIVDEAMHNEVAEHMRTHSLYNKRDAEWIKISKLM